MSGVEDQHFTTPPRSSNLYILITTHIILSYSFKVLFSYIKVQVYSKNVVLWNKERKLHVVIKKTKTYKYCSIYIYLNILSFKIT